MRLEIVVSGEAKEEKLDKELEEKKQRLMLAWEICQTECSQPSFISRLLEQYGMDFSVDYVWGMGRRLGISTLLEHILSFLPVSFTDLLFDAFTSSVVKETSLFAGQGVLWSGGCGISFHFIACFAHFPQEGCAFSLFFTD